MKVKPCFPNFLNVNLASLVKSVWPITLRGWLCKINSNKNKYCTIYLHTPYNSSDYSQKEINTKTSLAGFSDDVRKEMATLFPV